MGFGQSKPSLQEQLQQSKRDLNKTLRRVDRERTQLEQEEASLAKDARKALEQGRTGQAELIGRELVRARRHAEHFYNVRTQLRALQIQLQTVGTTHAMADAVRNASEVLSQVDAAIAVPQLSTATHELQRQLMRLEAKQELISDAAEATSMGDPRGESDQVKALLDKLNDEIAVDVASKTAEAASPTNHRSFASKRYETSMEQRLKDLNAS